MSKVFNGSVLFNLRRSKNLSQRKLAEELKSSINQAMISSWERHDMQPSKDYVDMLSIYFKQPVEEFYLDTSDKPIDNEVAALTLKRLKEAQKNENHLQLTVVGKFFEDPDFIAKDSRGLLYRVTPL